jgi:RND family efflux transporter MFP subunit
MRWKIIAAVVLAAVGVGAIGYVVFQPTFGAASSSTYITARATTTDVVKQAVATGTVAPHAIYGLAFGRDAQVVSSSSSSSNASGSGGSTTWTVTKVSVSIGDTVTKGQHLATADDSTAQLQLTIAQANLAAAEARLASDKAGPTSTSKAAMYDQVKQAQQQLTVAKQSYTDTVNQNKISVSQAKAAVTSAQDQLAADTKAGAPANVLAQDAAAVSNAKQSLTATTARATASNHQAANSVTSATLSLASAKNNYANQIAPATAAQIASDQSAVASAQAQLATAQATVDGAIIIAPADGVVTAVDITEGLVAPSGDAIEVAVAPMEVQATVTETDLTSLKVGQTATVTVAAVGRDIAGTVSQIDPTANASGGNSSVVTYPVVITLTGDTTDVQAGMSANVSVTTASATNVVAVPSTALYGQAGSYTVHELDSAGQVKSVSVQVGLISTSLAEITSGVAAGDTVVVGTSSSRTSTGSGTNGFGGGGFGGGGFGGGGRVFQP